MSALKHGFFRRGFMLCDRCVLGGKCEFFVPSGECAVEKKAFDGLVSRLMRQYRLGGLADEILVERVAMYLVRIARAEVYEANVGVSDFSVVWGRYIAGLDKTLRFLLRDLAITRVERKKLEKDDVLVDVDRLLSGLKQRSRAEPMVVRRTTLKRSPTVLLLSDWETDRPRLKSFVQGGRHVRRKEDSEDCS